MSTQPTKTIDFTCACGAKEALPASLRGIEQACDACGRIFRIPSTGDALDLRESAVADDSEDEVLQTLRRLAGPEPSTVAAQMQESRDYARLARMVWIVIGLIAVGLIIWWLV